MAVRSVSVRYSASVGSLISDLNRAAQANDRLATSADKAAAKQEQSANRQAKAGAVVALGLGVAIAKFAEFDAAMSGAQAASQTTGAELNNLRNAAIKAGADTQYSATEAANAITELSKAGVATSDILGGALTGSLNLAAAGQMDVADAAETAATAMTQFNLKGDQVNHIADLLAAGAGKAQGSVSDMGMALKQAGLVANQTGLSIEETTAGLTAFASAGLIGSDAGTSMKSMLQRLTPQSKEAAGLMKELGISAYDASGNFIGLEKFAGNLRTSLQDLTPEQRNAALATIFGSDAVRAASVLYDQGATGIAKWTSEVNQQGFAAKQAATLTDNLKGDIERLGGSFDTVLIQSGSGANDTLRTLVQTGEQLVNVLGTIPGPVLTGAAAFGALVLLGPKVSNLARSITGPLSGGMGTFRSNAALAKAQALGYSVAVEGAGTKSLTAGQRIRTLGTAMGGLKGAASGALGLLGGPWGIALTAATAGITMWAQKQADARAAADALSATIDEQTGKFTASSKATTVETLIGDISPEDINLLQRLGVSFSDLADKALAGGPAYDQARQKYADLANEYRRSGGLTSDEANALEVLVQHLNAAGDAAEATKVKQDVLNQARNNQIVADSAGAQSSAAAERGLTDVGNAASTAAGQMDESTTSTSGMNTLLTQLGAVSKETQDRIDGLSQALALLGGGTRAVQAATDAQAASIDKVAEAADKAKEATQKKTDKDYTSAEKARDVAAANRDYRAALRDVATDTLTLIDKQQSQNASVGTLTASYNTGRAAIEAQLRARGLHGAALQAETDKIIGTRDGFNKLLAEYAKNPGQVATTIKTPGLPKAKSDVQGYWTVINGVPTFHQTTFSAVTSTAASRIADLKAELAGVPRNITTTMTIRRIQNDIKLEENGVSSASAAGNIVTAYAGGGLDVPNGHVAEIATSGVRMWAEPETKGEAYIPFANDWRRPRAKAIAAEAVSRLGGNVQWFAHGGISAYAAGGVRAPLDSYYGTYITSLGEQVTAAILSGLRAAASKAVSDLSTTQKSATTRRANTAATLRQDRAKIAAAQTDVRRAKSRKDRLAAQKRLQAAQDKYDKDRRNAALATIKEDQAIAAGKGKIAAATKAIGDAQARQKIQSESALTKFGKGIAGGVRNTGAFIANLEKLASRGYVTLAQQLAQMSNEEAETLAAQAASASTATLDGIAKNVNTSLTQQQQLDNITGITAILGQLRTQNLGATDLASATGMSLEDVVTAAKLITTELKGNKNATRLLADLADLAKNGALGVKWFDGGGYTGDAATTAATGIVHGQEFVFDAAATRRYGAVNLEAMRRGRPMVISSPSTPAFPATELNALVSRLDRLDARIADAVAQGAREGTFAGSREGAHSGLVSAGRELVQSDRQRQGVR